MRLSVLVCRSNVVAELVVDGLCGGIEFLVLVRRLHSVGHRALRLRRPVRRRHRLLAVRQRRRDTDSRAQSTHANGHQLLRRQPGDVRRARGGTGDAAQGARVHGPGVRVVSVS